MAVITNLPVREGETVVIGIQNSPGSTLMTLADMSVITAEVKVDETDIVNVQLGNRRKSRLTRFRRKSFTAVVTEIGNNAIVRSTGVSTSQPTSSSQEAKDFKVVVTLQDPPEDLRPGLSTTAKITTATRSDAVDHSDPGTDHPRAARFGGKSRRKVRVQAAAPSATRPRQQARTMKSRACSSSATRRPSSCRCRPASQAPPISRCDRA